MSYRTIKDTFGQPKHEYCWEFDITIKKTICCIPDTQKERIEIRQGDFDGNVNEALQRIDEFLNNANISDVKYGWHGYISLTINGERRGFRSATLYINRVLKWLPPNPNLTANIKPAVKQHNSGRNQGDDQVSSPALHSQFFEPGGHTMEVPETDQLTCDNEGEKPQESESSFWCCGIGF